MKLLNFGSLNIDIVYRVDHTVRPGETLSSYDLSTHAGGKGANQSAALAKAGTEVFHAGKIGRDGTWLLDKLKSFGVNTSFVTVGEGKTGHAVIQVSKNGENAIVLYGGGNREITESEVTAVLDHFTSGDILLLQNEINNIPFIMELAAEKGMRIVFNPAPFDEAVKQYPLALVDLFIVNETEGSGLSGEPGNSDQVMNRLTALYPEKEVILTLGAGGVLYGKGPDRVRGNALSVAVTDTTAAGDTFIGYFLSGEVTGLPVKENLDAASAASALTVQKSGAMDSIPQKEEVKKFRQVR